MLAPFSMFFVLASFALALVLTDEADRRRRARADRFKAEAEAAGLWDAPGARSRLSASADARVDAAARRAAEAEAAAVDAIQQARDAKRQLEELKKNRSTSRAGGGEEASGGEEEWDDATLHPTYKCVVCRAAQKDELGVPEVALVPCGHTACAQCAANKIHSKGALCPACGVGVQYTLRLRCE